MRMPIKQSRETKPTLTIEKSKLLIVEGKDETLFFERLFKQLDRYDDIQIIEIGGVEQMSKKLSTLMLIPNFERVQSIGIVRDADQSFDSATQSLKKILENVGLTAPSSHNQYAQCNEYLQVGIFIMPGSNIAGTMLEDLCLHIVSDQRYLPLIQNYLDELAVADLELPSNIAKAKAQIYLASQKKIVHSIGLGAQKNYWNLEHSDLHEVKQFITNLVSGKKA